MTAGVPVGTYNLEYRLCQSSTSNCDNAVVRVTVAAASSVNAVDDAGSGQFGTASTPVANVRSNDTIGGSQANSSNSFLIQPNVGPSAWPAGFSLNATSGAVSMTSGVLVGTYDLLYVLCQSATTSCDDAVVRITVNAPTPPSVNAVNDSGSGQSGVASTPVANVRANDTFGGSQANSSNTTISEIGSWPTGFSLNTTSGAVSMTGGAPAGTYSLVYRLCQSSTSNCDDAVVEVIVDAPPVPTVNAVNDSGSGQSGVASTPVANVRSNDTIDGSQANSSNSTISETGQAWPTGFSLDTTSGAISMTSGVPAGTYNLRYRLCQSPTNCENARARVIVTDPPSPAATLVKGISGINGDTSLTAFSAVDDVINYTFTVENTGNVTLSNVVVNDPLPGLSAVSPASVATLLPGDSAEFTASYTIVQADIENGEVFNTASVTGSSPGNSNDVTDASSVSVAFLVDLIEQIEEQLTQILEDDLRETTTKQSRLFSDIAKGARDRLKAQSTEACVAELNSFVQNNPILFDTALAVLKPQSEPILDEVATILASCENGRIEIGGHTDSRGSDAYNIDLSQRRVNSVLAALEQRSVNTERLTARGYGERQPIADNSTAEGLTRNRRVVFTPLDTDTVVNEPCGAITPFGMRGPTAASNGSMNTNQEFGSESYNCVTGVRQIIRGDLSVSKEEGFGTQGMLSATIQRERLINEDHLTGRFIGGYFSRTNINGPADGTIDGYGAWAGLYGANRFHQDLYLDYYLAGSFGRHSYDLRFSNLPTGIDISADGTYNYWGIFGGLAISGESEFRDVRIQPRAGVDLRYASAWDANVTAQIPGISQSGTLSIDDQKGLRMFAELEFGFGFDPDSEDNLLTRQLSLTPRLYCDMLFESGTDDMCGVGMKLEYSMHNFSYGTAWGINLDAETSGDMDRSSVGIFYERSMFNGDGQMNLGADVTQGGSPQLTGGLEVQF